MNKEPLRFAECCGNCVHCNRPKQPSDHAAHYTVAKTQRWCYHHKFRTTREAVCDNFELEQKKGGIPAIKRVLNFHKRAERIKGLAEKMKDREIEVFGYTIFEQNGWLYRRFRMFGRTYEDPFEDDAGHRDDMLDRLEKELEE
jgi:hypothetical protein